MLHLQKKKTHRHRDIMENKSLSLHLTEFNISDKTGFVIENPVVTLLPYFKPWLDVFDICSRKNATDDLRQIVDDMPVLEVSSLTNYEETCFAHAVLSYIGHAYVNNKQAYTCDPELKHLPATLAVPWKAVSDVIGIFPVMSHSDVVLCNIVRKDQSSGFTRDNIQAIHHFPGMDNDGIPKIVGLMEIEFATGLQHIVEGDRHIQENNESGLTDSLRCIHQVLKKINAIFPLLNEYTDPETFFYKFLAFTVGWGGHGNPYPEGLVYEGVNNTPMQFISFSAAQSSIFQVLDAFLEIEHIPVMTERFHELRKYMPRGHRRFINTLETRKSAKTLVSVSKNEELVTAYDDCINEIQEFRTYHMKMVHKYTVVELKKLGIPSDGLMDTMKASRDATRAHKIIAD